VIEFFKINEINQSLGKISLKGRQPSLDYPERRSSKLLVVCIATSGRDHLAENAIFSWPRSINPQFFDAAQLPICAEPILLPMAINSIIYCGNL
jgi:hypothetical protein